jgi:hypothetical protein
MLPLTLVHSDGQQDVTKYRCIFLGQCLLFGYEMQTDILRGSSTFKLKENGTKSEDAIHQEIVVYSFYATGPTQNSFPPFVNRHNL